MNDQVRQNGSGWGTLAVAPGVVAATGRRSAQPLFHADCMWVDGELVPLGWDDTPGRDAFLAGGRGVSETLRCYMTARGPAIFRLEGHLQRFLQAVAALGVPEFGWSLPDLRRAVAATVQANYFQSCLVRATLSLAAGGQAQLVVTAWEQSRLEDGGVPDLATGGDAALYAVRDGVIIASPGAGAAAGIAHDTVITLAGDLGYPVVDEHLSHDRLYTADEVFVCGTAAEVAPVREIDFRVVGDGQVGPVSAAVQSLYFETARGRGSRSAGWVEYVLMEPLY
jgi:branched-chain amino acid aminotransferase